ncbi:solute carrier family 23 member 2 [Rhipicephalus microplus]|uniref:solute carrier family 23 member 2 n=1 Tax=Rhipicephalus microplus TaxID=6941 RepID=UPI003F6B35AC
MDVSDYKAGTPPRGLQDVSMLQSQENGMPSSSRNRFRVLGKLRPKLPAMLHFDREQPHKRKRKKLAAFYDVHEQPIITLSLLLSLQHYMTVQGLAVLQPKALSKFLCTEEDNPAIGLLVGSTSFIAGIGTLVQTTAGVRLPVIQSGALTMASPAVAELKYDSVPCPDNSTFDDEIWTSRILEMQASTAVGALTELFMGGLGFVGLFHRWITPLTMTPAIALIGLSNISAATEPASTSWTIAAITAALITLLSHYLTPCRPSSDMAVVKRVNDSITFFSILPCASLRVVQVAAVIMIVFGLITKESMFMLSIPTPIVGGMLLVLLSTLTGVGLAHLRYVDLTSSRNVFIVGVSLAMGLVIPMHVGPASDFVITRVRVIDRVIYAFFSTGSVIGGFVGCLLDHTIPGTEEERGILKMRECFDEAGARAMVARDPLRHWQYYSVPCFEKLLKKFPVLRKLPIMPEREPHVSYVEDE